MYFKRMRLDRDDCCNVDKPELRVYYTSVSARIVDKKIADKKMAAL